MQALTERLERAEVRWERRRGLTLGRGELHVTQRQSRSVVRDRDTETDTETKRQRDRDRDSLSAVRLRLRVSEHLKM